MERRRNAKHHILLTGFSSDRKAELSLKIQSLGGIYSETENFLPECTHIICGKPSRSEKYLGGLATGKWLLTAAFLDDSYHNGKWMNEDKYEWNETKRHLVANTELAVQLKASSKWRRHVAETGQGAFVGWRAAVLVDHSQKKAVYKRLIQCGQGEVVDLRLPIARPAQVAQEVTHVFVDQKLEGAVKSLLRRGVLCLQPMYIGAFLLLDPPPDPTSYLVGDQPQRPSMGVMPSPATSVYTASDTCSSSASSACNTPSKPLDLLRQKLLTEELTARLPAHKDDNKVTTRRQSNGNKATTRRHSNVDTATTRQQSNVDTASTRVQRRASLRVSSSQVKVEPEVTNSQEKTLGVASVVSQSTVPGDAVITNSQGLPPVRECTVKIIPVPPPTTDAAKTQGSMPAPPPLTDASRTSRTKRKILDTDLLQEAITTAKRLKLGESKALPWPPVASSKQPRKVAMVTNKATERLSLPLSDAMMGIFEACIDEVQMYQALDVVLSFVSSTRYPQPKMVQCVLTKILQISESVQLSKRAYSTLQRVLAVHPPTTPALATMYLRSLKAEGKTEAGEEWDFIKEVISGALGNGDPSPVMIMNHTLMLEFIVSLLEQDFQHHSLRMLSVLEKKPLSGCMMSRVMWPSGQMASMNAACLNLITCLIDATQSINTRQPQADKIRVMRLLQSLVAMAAQCCHLGALKNATLQRNMQQLPENAEIFARELAYRINGELDESPDQIQLLLETMEPPWLVAKVCDTLLGLYDNRLIPMETDQEMAFTLEKIVRVYFYLLPRLTSTQTIMSPHKKGQRTSSINGQQVATPTPGHNFATPVKKMKSTITTPGSMKRRLATINKRNARGETPLHTACIKNNIMKVRELLAIPGIDVNMKDFAGWTPLHEACNHGFLDCVMELLRYKPPKTIDSYFSKGSGQDGRSVDLRACNDEGITPLHDAIQNNHVEVAQLLLQYGGPSLLDMRTTDGQTPAALAWSDEMTHMLSSPIPPRTPSTPLTPYRKQANSQGSMFMSSQDSSQGSTAGGAFCQPSEESYADVLSNQRASREECIKYLTLVLHTLKAYINFAGLNTVWSVLNGVSLVSLPDTDHSSGQADSGQNGCTCSDVRSQSSASSGSQDSEGSSQRRSNRIAQRLDKRNSAPEENNDNNKENKNHRNSPVQTGLNQSAPASAKCKYCQQSQDSTQNQTLHNDLKIMGKFKHHMTAFERHLLQISGEDSPDFLQPRLAAIRCLALGYKLDK